MWGITIALQSSWQVSVPLCSKLCFWYLQRHHPFALWMVDCGTQLLYSKKLTNIFHKKITKWSLCHMCMYNNKLHCELVDVNNSNNKLNWLSYIPRAFYKNGSWNSLYSWSKTEQTVWLLIELIVSLFGLPQALLSDKVNYRWCLPFLLLHMNVAI